MPNGNIHREISRCRTGNDFAELHKWIDYPTKTLGVNHRKINHAFTIEKANMIKEYWNKKGKGMGDKAVVEWLFHIAIDNLDTAYKTSFKAYGHKTFNHFEIDFDNNGNLSMEMTTN